uniref:Uncharacterized protein n=1 Tax=Leersia perrieri TaxID=77586 RepID=A0A0D9V7Z6_9ORYZ
MQLRRQIHFSSTRSWSADTREAKKNHLELKSPGARGCRLCLCLCKTEAEDMRFQGIDLPRYAQKRGGNS